MRVQTDRASFGAGDEVKRAGSGRVGGLALGRLPQHLGVHARWRAARLRPVPRRPQGDRRRRHPEHRVRDRGHREAPFDKGRTLTHEVGHWLNLRHIWGDTLDCSGGDRVADTPNCEGPNTGSPTFPVITCSNGPNGDMFMNYMDYTDDAAMFMFTAGQVARMSACLAGPRKSFAPA